MECPLSDSNTFNSHFPVIRANAGHCVVSVCLKPGDSGEPTKKDRWFPAVIDTGCTHSLMIGDNQLGILAGRRIGEFKYNESFNCTVADGSTRTLPTYDANLWIKSNQPNTPDRRIELTPGFAYAATNGPPVPLIGVKAMVAGKLSVAVDYPKRRFCVMAKRERFGRWLVRNGHLTRAQLQHAIDWQITLLSEQPLPLIDADRLCRLLLAICDHSDAGRAVWDLAHRHGILSGVHPQSLFNHHPGGFIGSILVRAQVIDEATLSELLARYRFA